jgi:hypothetical protein
MHERWHSVQLKGRHVRKLLMMLEDHGWETLDAKHHLQWLRLEPDWRALSMSPNAFQKACAIDGIRLQVLKATVARTLSFIVVLFDLVGQLFYNNLWALATKRQHSLGLY